jgi:hypothetical protein
MVSMTDSANRSRRSATAVLGALAALAAVLALAGLAGAQGEGDKPEPIGKTEKKPDPSCPDDPCQAIGSVTGFQVSAGKEKALMTAPEDGELVAWSVNLSKPKNSQQEFFGKFYKEENLGTVPTARIAVLKHRQANEYKLKGQGPIEELDGELGDKSRFSLEEPIPLREGDIIALTVPTWIPNFAVDLSQRNTWRASREKGKCEDANDIKKGKPQEKVGSTRLYQCLYRQARILYTAFFIPA